MTENKQKYLTTGQFAAALGVHPKTVIKWDNQGKIRAHHRSAGGRRYYSQEQVDKYIEKFYNKEKDLLSD